MTKLDEATLTSQGQISIPKKIREKLHLAKGQKVVFLEDGKGRIVLEHAEVPIEFTHQEWQEFLRRTEKEPVTRLKGKEQALRHLDRMIKNK